MKIHFLGVFVGVALPLVAAEDFITRIGGSLNSAPSAGVAGLALGDQLTYKRQSTRTLPFYACNIGIQGAKETPRKFRDLCALLSRDYVAQGGKMVPRGKSGGETISGTVLQRQNATAFLLTKPDCLILTAEPRAWVDGDMVGPVRVAYDGIFEFVSVAGGKRSVRRYVELGGLMPLQPETVMLELHQGAVFNVSELERRTCPICIGKGKLRGDGRLREDESKLKPCPLGSDGLAEFTTIFVLRWKP